ncbi:MAG: hypothetical protein ACI9ZF_003447 [Bradyrhizobium sp.]|jgi:hypothetical protein
MMGGPLHGMFLHRILQLADFPASYIKKRAGVIRKSKRPADPFRTRKRIGRFTRRESMLPPQPSAVSSRVDQ